MAIAASHDCVVTENQSENSVHERFALVAKYAMNSMYALVLVLGVMVNCRASDRKAVEILWSDTGVFVGDRPGILREWDQHLFEQVPESISLLSSDVARENTIAIPMPNAIPPRNTADFGRFVDTLTDGIAARLRVPVRTGAKVEIRTFQDIAIQSGYWDPRRQADCVRFTEAVLLAMEKACHRLEGQADFNLSGMVGSNGGYVATEAIVNIGRQILSQLTVVDGRAYVATVLKAAELLQGRLTIVNTGGDTPAFSDMIGSLAGSASVKKRDRRVGVIYMDPSGFNYPWGLDHLALFENGLRDTLVKEMKADGGWSGLHKMAVVDLRKSLIDRVSRPGGVSFEFWSNVSREEPSRAGFRAEVINDAVNENKVFEIKSIGTSKP